MNNLLVMDGGKLAAISAMEKVSCCACGTVFAVNLEFVNKRREDKRAFYCPNGHELVFMESETDRLRRQVAQLTSRCNQVSKEADRQREAKERKQRQLSATRGQITKIKNRIGRGVCPCCNRTFQNLAQHMHQEHPGFAGSQAGESEE